MYIYDGANVLEELDTTGAMTARYTGGAGIDEPLATMRAGNTTFYEADGLGSVTSLTKSDGTPSSFYSYDSFGNVISSGGRFAAANPVQYTGREFDSETGLYYYRARYYDPSVGRFLSEDPAGFAGGINRYAYVRNSPINLTDPFGLCDQKKCTAAQALLTSLGGQLSQIGDDAKYIGYGAVGAAALGGFLAPEGAPAEVGLAEAGVAVIEFGSTISTLGAGLSGSAGGVYNGALAAGYSAGAGKLSALLTGGSVTLPGINGSLQSVTRELLSGFIEKSGLVNLLGNISSALKAEEVACGSN